MIDFRPIELSDKKWMDERYKKADYASTYFCFTTNYLTRKDYNIMVADVDGFLCMKGVEDGNTLYLFPVGDGDLRGIIKKYIQDAKERNVPLIFNGILEEHKVFLEENFPENFACCPLRSGFDYIYKTDDLVELPGNERSDKRKGVNFFKSNFEWSCEKLTDENLSECVDMHRKWYVMNQHKANDSFEQEKDFANNMLLEYKELKLTGLILRVEDEIVAFALGEPISSNTFMVHVEKAYTSLRGAYAMINQLFAIEVQGKYEYIDRSYDLGIEGLRKVKMLYGPTLLMTVYRANYVKGRIHPRRILRNMVKQAIGRA